MPRPPALFYPTAPVRRLTAPGGGTWQLAGTIHAREVGRRVTDCGVPTPEWPMLFYRPFDGEQPDSCTACVEVVGGGRPRRSDVEPNSPS